jgi:hypothetical protein
MMPARCAATIILAGPSASIWNPDKRLAQLADELDIVYMHDIHEAPLVCNVGRSATSEQQPKHH